MLRRGRKPPPVASFAARTRLSSRGERMGRRKRRCVDPTHEWEQIELLCAWGEQVEYERIRPLVLFGEPVPERLAQTGVRNQGGRRSRDLVALVVAGDADPVAAQSRGAPTAAGVCGQEQQRATGAVALTHGGDCRAGEQVCGGFGEFGDQARAVVPVAARRRRYHRAVPGQFAVCRSGALGVGAGPVGRAGSPSRCPRGSHGPRPTRRRRSERRVEGAARPGRPATPAAPRASPASRSPLPPCAPGC